jgi:hypothetical protein
MCAKEISLLQSHIEHCHLAQISSIALRVHLVCGRSAVVGRNALVISRFAVGARVLGGVTGSLIQDVARVDGFIVIAFCLVKHQLVRHCSKVTKIERS